MATVSHLGSIWDTNAGNHTVTATPAVGDLIVVFAANSGRTKAQPPTITDNNGGGTYTRIPAADYIKSASADSGWVFVRDALIASATSTIFTATQSGDSGGGLTVMKITGMSRVGLAAVRQVKVQNNVASGTPAVTFSMPALTGNPLIGIVNSTTNGSANSAPPTGWTEAVDTGYNVPANGRAVEFRSSGHTSAVVTFGAAAPSAFGTSVVEFEASATVPGTAPHAYRDAVAALSPVAYWRLEDASNALTLLSQIGPNLAADTGLTSLAGMIDNALQPSASGQGAMGGAFHGGRSSGSILAWVKFPTSAPAANNFWFGHRDSLGNEMFWSLLSTGVFQCRVDGSAAQGNANYTPTLDGQWHLLGLTWDGSNVRSYQDGVLQNTVACATTWSAADAPMWVWEDPTGFSTASTVPIDEVAIFNAVLTAQNQLDLVALASRSGAMTAVSHPHTTSVAGRKAALATTVVSHPHAAAIGALKGARSSIVAVSHPHAAAVAGSQAAAAVTSFVLHFAED